MKPFARPGPGGGGSVQKREITSNKPLEKPHRLLISNDYLTKQMYSSGTNLFIINPNIV